MQVDLSQYPGKCETCGSPARLETIYGETIGVESFQVCVNPKCWQFDSWIAQKREIEEAKIRQTAAFRRHEDNVWRRHRAKVAGPTSFLKGIQEYYKETA